MDTKADRKQLINAIEALADETRQMRESFDLLRLDLGEQKLINQVVDNRMDIMDRARVSMTRRMAMGKL